MDEEIEVDYDDYDEGEEQGILVQITPVCNYQYYEC